MAIYSFKGQALSGQSISGRKNSRDSSDLESKLAEEGVVLVSYQKESISLSDYLRARFKRTEITRLTRQFSVLISSGITVTEALESVREQTNDRSISAIFLGILESVRSGESLKLAFGGYPAYFDSVYLALLETGEISGTLDVSCERIASYRERTERLNKKIKSALAYPALVLLVSILVVFALVVYIIPIFSSMYAGFGIELPTLTQRIVEASEFLKGAVWAVPLLLGAVTLLVFFALRSKTVLTRVGRIIRHLPIVGNLYVKLATSRFCRTLGTLLTSGLQLIDAVSVAARTTGSAYFEKLLEFLPRDLGQGESLAKSLGETKVFPKTVIRMTAAGESTGRLGEMFSKTADFYEAEVDTEIATMTSLIEPIVIVILGFIVGFILIAMYLPLFELIGQVGEM